MYPNICDGVTIRRPGWNIDGPLRGVEQTPRFPIALSGLDVLWRAHVLGPIDIIVCVRYSPSALNIGSRMPDERENTAAPAGTFHVGDVCVFLQMQPGVLGLEQGDAEAVNETSDTEPTSEAASRALFMRMTPGWGS
jgi:hypothetical protein